MISLIYHDSRVRSQWGRCSLPRYMGLSENGPPHGNVNRGQKLMMNQQILRYYILIQTHIYHKPNRWPRTVSHLCYHKSTIIPIKLLVKALINHHFSWINTYVLLDVSNVSTVHLFHGFPTFCYGFLHNIPFTCWIKHISNLGAPP
jgi:hypothetical protein